MLKFFCFIFFISFSANAAELINVLPEVTESQTLYSTYRRMSSIVPFIPQLNEIILKQKNANILITRGFPMPFKVSDINAANQELLNAEQSKMTPKAIKTLFSRFIQCYPDKKLCMEDIPDDLSKYLTLSEAEKNILSATQKQKKPSSSPVRFLSEDADFEEKLRFYDRLILARLRKIANEVLESSEYSFDDSILTMSAEEELHRHNIDYQALINQYPSDEKIHLATLEALSTLPTDVSRSALCLSIRDDKPFKQNKYKISYTAPDSTTYTFESVDRKTDDDPFYVISINGTRQNDERLSERFLLDIFSMHGFFEYKNHVFLTMSRGYLGQEEKRIFQFDPTVYAFLPVCMLNKDMTVFHIDAAKEDMPLCRRITRKEYNVYLKKPLTKKLTAAQLKDFFALECPPENQTCINEQMYNFRDKTGIFADYDNNGTDDILYEKDQRLFVYLPEQQKSTLLIETPEKERQQIIQIDNQNYLLTTEDYRLNTSKSPLDESFTWQSFPKNLYKIVNGKAPEQICSFTPIGEYH